MDFNLTKYDTKMVKLGRDFFVQIFSKYIEPKYESEMERLMGYKYDETLWLPLDNDNMMIGMYNLLRDLVPPFEDIALRQKYCYKYRKMFDLYVKAYYFTQYEFAGHFGFFNWEQFKDFVFEVEIEDYVEPVDEEEDSDTEVVESTKEDEPTEEPAEEAAEEEIEEEVQEEEPNPYYNQMTKIEFFKEVFALMDEDPPWCEDENDLVERKRMFGDGVKAITKVIDRKFKICIKDKALFSDPLIIFTVSDEDEAKLLVEKLSNEAVYGSTFYYYPVSPEEDEGGNGEGGGS